MRKDEPNLEAARWGRFYWPWLLAILVVSLGLRVWLVSTGGQGFWPDEMRYSAAGEAVGRFEHGAWREGWVLLIGTADHLFFKIVGLPVAWWEVRHGDSPALVAGWFGLFSVFAIGLIAAIARAAGAGPREGLLATFFAAGANSLFYYSRHFFPYDVSLFFCLLALWLSLGRDAWWRSGLAGLAAGLGFLSYNGYWLLGGVVLSFHVLRGGAWRRRVTRGAAAGVGLFAPIVGVVLAARMLDRDLVASFQQFARSIILGDFGRGWIFVWQYLWAAEGFLLIVWLLLAGLALNLVRGARFQRVALWLGLALAVYAGLVLGADVLRTFVVYGRTARMLVPLLCLAAAAGADALAARWSQRWMGGALLIAMAAGAAGHMAEVLQQKFPDEFRRQASQRALLARKESPALMRMLNAEGLFAGPVASEPRPHTLLLRQRHPLQFEPALFEGFNEERRRQFQTSDISMQLVAVPAVSLPDMGAGYPGPVRLRVRFPGPRPGGEPLLTCGEPRKANFFYVQYPDPGHIRIGYDCWGRAGRLSEPIPIDYSREHEVILSCDALLPPGAPMPAGMSAVEWARLQGSLLVAIDGAAILTDRTATNPAAASSIFAGANLVGGSTANEWFSGEILSIDRASWADVTALFEPDWTGYPGPLRLQVRVPRGVEGTADPLVVSGVTGGADFVYVRYLSDDRVSLGYDHWGAGGPESRPLRLGDTRLLNIVVSHGGLMPPQEAGFYRRVPTAVPLRNSVVVAVDDQVVLRALASPHSSTAKTITLGQNLVGGSTTTGRFGGEIISARSEPVDAVLRLLKGGPVSR